MRWTKQVMSVLVYELWASTLNDAISAFNGRSTKEKISPSKSTARYQNWFINFVHPLKETSMSKRMNNPCRIWYQQSQIDTGLLLATAADDLLVQDKWVNHEVLGKIRPLYLRALLLLAAILIKWRKTGIALPSYNDIEKLILNWNECCSLIRMQGPYHELWEVHMGNTHISLMLVSRYHCVWWMWE